MKEHGVASILPVGSVVTILTPPGPCRPSDLPASSIQSSQSYANSGVVMPVVQRQPEWQPAGTGWSGSEHAGRDEAAGPPGRDGLAGGVVT